MCRKMTIRNIIFFTYLEIRDYLLYLLARIV